MELREHAPLLGSKFFFHFHAFFSEGHWPGKAGIPTFVALVSIHLKGQLSF